MRPAFSTTGQAAAFAVLLLAVLLSPMLFTKSMLPPRGEVYLSMPRRFGAFNYLHKKMYDEKGDIDIAFIGSSRVWAGIDTPHVQAELSKKLGRKAVVITAAWSWLGFDATYFITRDLLQNRKVHMIVFDDEYRADEIPHVAATHWFRFAENAAALKGMPAHIQAAYYYAAILGMPRNLLSLLRPNIPDDLVFADHDPWPVLFHAHNPAERSGALVMERGISLKAPFIRFIPQGGAKPEDVCIYSRETAANFRISGPTTSAWQLQFAKQFADLARENHTKLVFLHLQAVYSNNETNNPVIQEREFWPDVLGVKMQMVGIPPAKLFSGISDEDYPKLFYTGDHYHFNRNGAEYFTSLITPALIKIYEAAPTN